MTPERWQQLEQLYQAALEMGTADRLALLQSADPELRDTVNSILAQESKPPASGLSLNRPVWEAQPGLLGTSALVAPGMHWGPYRIDQPIGRGGMGEVFRATDTRLNRTVAIKTCFWHFTERFEREARAIATLNHPHIAALYDVGSSPSGFAYLVLEYVDGPTLADLIAKGPIHPEEVRRMAFEISAAIEAAHEKGIVHRDLKPANIKLGEGHSIKVLDFGLAKALREGPVSLSGDTTEQGVILGTPSYISPEQALGSPADRRSDVWSFGVVLAEMLSGKKLFNGGTSSEILAAVIQAEADLSSVPPAWLPLLRRCLTKDLRHRLQAIGEARIALENPLEVATTSPRRRLSWLGLDWLSIGIVLALVLLAFTWWIRRSPHPPIDNPFANATFTPLTDYNGTETDAAISPDGKFVAFLSDRGGLSHVWLDRIGVGSPIDLTPGTGDQRGPLRSLGFSRDGAEIWLAGTERRRLQMLPLLGGRPRLFLSDRAVAPSWSSDGAKVAFHTSEPGDPIFVADSDGANAHQLFRDAPGKHNHYLTWSAVDNFIYFVNGTPATAETDLWRLSSSGGKPERLTYLNSELRDPTPLPNGTIVYIARERDRSGSYLWSYDIAQKVSRRISSGLEQYTSVSASSDGRKFAVTIANPTVRLWSIPLRDTLVTEADVQPFPPDARRVFAPRFRGGVVFYLSSSGAGDELSKWEGGRSTPIWGAGQGLAEPPAISPDGKQIAEVTRQNGKRRLRLISADGAESSTIAPDLEVEGTADWSPDGRWIVIGADNGRGKGLFKIPAAGGPPVRLTRTVARNPVWSPNGSVIAYSGSNVFALEPVALIRPDGTPLPVPEIRTHRDGERLRFTPDGKSLIYMQASEATPWQDFWQLDMTTRKTRRLTNLSDRATMRTFDITADGTRIVFDREQENAAVILIDTNKGK